MTSTNIAVTVLVAGILIALGMILRFLWLVYDRGGPKHVLDVARALRQVYDPNWVANLGRFLPGGDVTTTKEGANDSSSEAIRTRRQ